MRLSGTALVALLAIGTSTSVLAAPCRASRAKYRALKAGATLKSVVARLGCKGRKVAEVRYGKRHRVNYSWRGHGRFGANIVLTFVNGRLADKSELGLD